MHHIKVASCKISWLRIIALVATSKKSLLKKFIDNSWLSTFVDLLNQLLPFLFFFRGRWLRLKRLYIFHLSLKNLHFILKLDGNYILGRLNIVLNAVFPTEIKFEAGNRWKIWIWIRNKGAFINCCRDVKHWRLLILLKQRH